MSSLSQSFAPESDNENEESQPFAAVTVEKAPPAKKQKRCIEDDLVCPITLELPFEPVTAEDGR